MTKRSPIGRPARQEPARMQPRHCAMRSGLKLITMRMIACCAGLLGLSMGFASFATAEDIGGVIALPDLPFVIPVLPPLPPAPASNADPANPDGPDDVITQRNNNLRTGTSVQRGLNQALVSDGHFGFLQSLAVDGAVLAQPLFMESVQFPNGRHSAIFIATSTNWVYAFDADPPFDKLWEHNLGPPFRVDDPWNPNNPNPEVKSCTSQMATTEQDDKKDNANKQQVVFIGIEATPAIDPKLNRLVVSYRSADGARGGVPRIAALDIRTGNFVKGADGGDLDHPVTDNVADNVADNPNWNNLHRNRASLLIEHGVVYVGYSARCEGSDEDFKKSYQGWIYAFDVQTLAFAGRYRTMQDPVGVPPQQPSDDKADGGGIWQGSTGLAADDNGNIYFSTGNGRKGSMPPDALGKNLSNSVIRLRVNRAGEPSQRPVRIRMTAADWFTPYRKLWQDEIDLDFGSAGVVLIPNTRYLVMGGKEGMLYVLDRNDLGKFDDTANFKLADVFCKGKTSADAGAQDDHSRDRDVQKIPVGINQYCSQGRKALFCFGTPRKGCPEPPNADGLMMDDWISWPHIHGTPVFGAFGDGRAFLYIWPEKDYLKSFRWRGGGLETTPTYATGLPSNLLTVIAPPRVLAPPYLKDKIGATGMPGGMLSLTIDPSRPDGGVLFASVQRCRSSATDPTRGECAIDQCVTAENCQEQKFGMLRAFDPITLRELWNNQIDVFANDEAKDYWFAKYVPPTIAKGRVYLATASRKVLVYGRWSFPW